MGFEGLGFRLRTIGIMENKIETTIFCRDYVGVILGLYWDNGNKMETTRDYIQVILGFYWDNGKENGNYYLGFSGLGV